MASMSNVWKCPEIPGNAQKNEAQQEQHQTTETSSKEPQLKQQPVLSYDGK